MLHSKIDLRPPFVVGTLGTCVVLIDGAGLGDVERIVNFVPLSADNLERRINSYGSADDGRMVGRMWVLTRAVPARFVLEGEAIFVPVG